MTDRLHLTPADAPDPAIADGLAERDALHAQDEADRELGRTMRDMIDAAHAPGSGARFRDAILKPTRPGTPARARQDRAWQLLAARLNRLIGDIQ